LFLLEGLPAVALGVVVLFYLTDTPQQARWLEPEQREWLAATIRAEQAAAETRHGIRLGAALRHPTVLLLCLILLACQTCSYGLQLWIPQILRAMGGLSDLEVGLVSAIPYIAASIGMIAIGASSDRTGERLLHLAIPTAIGALSFAASAYFSSPVLGILALSIAAIGVNSTRGPFWALPTRFLTGSAAAGGIAVINMVASLGGIIGPYAVRFGRYLAGGNFAGGMLALGLVMLIGALLCVPLSRAKVLTDD
jgi:sugar phosphate permease